MKKLILALLVFVAGMYVTAFGLFTLSIAHMFWTGVALTVLGILTLSMLLILLWEDRTEKRYYDRFS
jgi:membrane protein implicated in regulation of membrane protease activity